MLKTTTLITALLLSSFCHAQWDTLNTQTHTDFHSIAFSNASNGVAVGYDATAQEGRIYHTTDGGQTWVLAHTGTNSKNDACFSDASHAWVAGDSGVIKQSGDAGAMWSVTYLGTKNFYSVFFPSDSVGYIGGEDGVLYRTSDTGGSWDTLNSQTTNAIRDIYFSNDLVGWIVCDGGYIGATTDGGQTWMADTTNPYFGFFQCKSIGFAGASQKAFVVGDDGLMVASTDNGLSWTASASGSAYDLHCIRFSNDLSGVMVGDSGYIARTWVGGPNFANESMSYVKEKLTKVCYANDSTAYICGYNGRILKSNTDISSVHAFAPAMVQANAYPNPFNDELHFALQLKNPSDVNMIITDLSGRIVSEENFGELHAGENIIPAQHVSSLAAGTYLATIITSSGRVSIPVIRN